MAGLCIRIAPRISRSASASRAKGLHETLRHTGARIPLEIHEVPSGTPVLDGTVPCEWVPRSAAIRRLDGRRFRRAQPPPPAIEPRHRRPAVSYGSATRPGQHSGAAGSHPLRTACCSDSWGFHLPRWLRKGLVDEAYCVHTSAELKQRSLSCRGYLLPGESEAEVLISIHSCHTSLANDNLSGIALGLELARVLATRRRRLNWRFLFLARQYRADRAWAGAHLPRR
ncbi:DUF4910 domain-containing protein [Belnapia moabensis]|uniref:DUF4910 domain-containing protein n=1 Tax=Belnapia moabensis TaxID=365533 RepID=UPI0009FF36B5